MKTIVLSAGHGGRDPGAVANGLREKDFNLAVVLATRDYLNQNYEGHKLVLPRDSDVFVSLPDRRDLTREVDADLYVSCHANSFNNPAAHGFETFVHSGPLYDVTLDYREAIHSHIYKYLSTLSIRDRGMKRHDHWVTRNMPCPTVLVEYFFVSNPREAEFGKSPKHIKEMGIATAKGIADALNLPMVEQPSKPEPPAPEEPEPPTDEDIFYRVIVGSYNDRSNADRRLAEVKQKGFSDAFIVAFRRN